MRCVNEATFISFNQINPAKGKDGLPREQAKVPFIKYYDLKMCMFRGVMWRFAYLLVGDCHAVLHTFCQYQ